MHAAAEAKLLRQTGGKEHECRHYQGIFSSVVDYLIDILFFCRNYRQHDKEISIIQRSPYLLKDVTNFSQLALGFSRLYTQTAVNFCRTHEETKAALPPPGCWLSVSAAFAPLREADGAARPGFSAGLPRGTGGERVVRPREEAQKSLKWEQWRRIS